MSHRIILISSAACCLLVLLQFLLVGTGVESVSVKVKPSAELARRRRTTASVRSHAVNLSRLLWIPPALRPQFPPQALLISTEDRAAQARASSALRTWAEAVLNCQDVNDAPLESDRCAGVEDKPELWASRVQCDALSVHAWNILGVTLVGAKMSALIRGQPVHKRTCLIQAVTCDPTYGRAWYNLAQQLNVGAREGFELRGKTYQKLDALVMAVTHDPDNSDAWNALCATLSPVGDTASSTPTSVTVAGRHIDKITCYVEAVDLSPENPFAWNNLGNAIQQAQLPDSIVTLVNGESVSNRDCYQRALKLDPTFSIALYNLGTLLHFGETVPSFFSSPSAGGDDLHDRVWTKKQLIEEAFRYDFGGALRQNGHVMTNVGHSLTMQESAQLVVQHQDRTATAAAAEDDATDGGDEIRSFTKLDCYVAALELDSTISDAWNGLGSVLLATNNNDNVNKRMKTAKLTLTTTKKVQEFSAIDCFVQSIRNDPTRAATAWMNLGDVLPPMPTSDGNMGSQQQQELLSVNVFGDDRRFGKRSCYVELLKLEPENSDAWGKLGIVLSDEKEPSVRVGSRRYSAQDCFVEAILHDDRNVNAWYNLGVSIGDATKSIEIRRKSRGIFAGRHNEHSEKVTPRDCFAQALSIVISGGDDRHQQQQQQHDDELISAAWNGLGNSVIHDHDRVTIPGLAAPLTRRQCYVNAVEKNPKFSTAWMNLGVSMGSPIDEKTGKTPHTTVHVRPFGKLSQQDCFVQAVQADETNADAWYNLVLLMGQHDSITVHGKVMDKTAVMAKYDAEVAAANTARGRPSSSDL